MKKTVIALLAAVLILSLGIGTFANGGYTMKNLPGTQDIVTNMPEDSRGIGMEEFAVSDTVPVREGYEFIGWILDYGPVVSYTVRYLEYGTEIKLAEEKVVNGLLPESEVSETAIDIDLYNKVGETSRTLTLDKDSAKNVITFYYSKVPVAPYTVKYMGPDPASGEMGEIHERKSVPGNPIGSEVREEAEDIENYTLNDDPEKTLTVSGNEEENVIIFYYEFAARYSVTYVVEPDRVYGIPEDSVVPTDSTLYAPGTEVTVAAQLTTTQAFGINAKTGEERPGTWTFVGWDTDDFQIYADTTITGGWQFVTDYKVTYVVEPDPVYGTPDDSAVPTDSTWYAPGDPVTVADQLTTTQETGINSKTGEERPGTWEFIPWDKTDFQIYEDTAITGEWKFISKFKYTVHHLDIDTYDMLAADEVYWLDELGQVEPQSKIPKTEFFTKYQKSKYNPVTEKVYLNKRKDFLLPDATYAKNKNRYIITVTLTEDDQHIFFFYQRGELA